MKDNNSHNGGHRSHGWLMMLGCLLPIVIIMALPLWGIKIGRFSSLAFLLCPLMHIGMMFMSKSGKRTCHGSNGPAEGSQE
jgi:hypothetical protein